MLGEESLQLIKGSDFTGHLSLLGEIPDKPKELYLQGTLPSEEHKLLAVVGSRRYSNYGKEACESLLAGLMGYPISIVSGLAIGMDTIAHKAALDAGLHTTAMPGSGIDRSVLHPKSNHALADRIVASGGCLLSEYEPLVPAGLHTFPRRNRLMAGLARAVLVIEAGEKSGTLITARLATEYNKDVLVVPGPIFNNNSQGVGMLLRLGATPITKSEDILEALDYSINTSDISNTSDTSSNLGSEGVSNSTHQRKINLDDLTPDERKVIELLAIEPLPRDQVIQTLGLPTHTTNTLLITLELRGLIVESLGLLRLT